MVYSDNILLQIHKVHLIRFLMGISDDENASIHLFRTVRSVDNPHSRPAKFSIN
jgi:hypothetical protein